MGEKREYKDDIVDSKVKDTYAIAVDQHRPLHKILPRPIRIYLNAHLTRAILSTSNTNEPRRCSVSQNSS